MPQVRVAVGGPYLGSGHQVAAVRLGLDVVRLERAGKAGPARPGVELVEGAEQRLARDDVYVDARLVVVPVRVLKRPLRGVVLRHLVLQGREGVLELVVRRLLEITHGMGSRCSSPPLLHRGYIAATSRLHRGYIAATHRPPRRGGGAFLQPARCRSSAQSRGRPPARATRHRATNAARRCTRGGWWEER